MRARRGSPARLAAVLAAGVVATLATAWAPHVRLALRAAPAPPSDLGVWLVDRDRRILGTCALRTWVSECTIASEPFAPEPLASAQACVPVDAAPRWALRPSGAFGDGFVPPKRVIDAHTEATGWPWRCAAGYTLSAPNDGYFAYERRGWFEPNRPTGRLALPIHFLWRGAVADLALWSAAAWLLVSAPGALRRRGRLARGCCPACGYPAAGLGGQTCPECGSALCPRV